MKFTHYLLVLATLFVVSCGREYTNGTRAPASVGGESSAARTLSANEKARALNICYAFRSKKTNFTGLQLGGTFSFDVEESDCENKKYKAEVNSTLKQVLLSQPLVFDVDNSKFIFNEVQTHDYGVMLPVCEALFQGDNIMNSYDNGLGEKIGLSFTSDADSDRLTVDYARPVFDSAGEKVYEVYQKDVHTIEAKQDAPTPTYGMILNTERVKVCDDSTRTYRYTQTYRP